MITVSPQWETQGVLQLADTSHVYFCNNQFVRDEIASVLRDHVMVNFDTALKWRHLVIIKLCVSTYCLLWLI